MRAIDDPELDEAVRELAAVTGEAEDVLLKVAVKERLDRVTRRAGKEYLARIREITSRVAALPVLDPRSPDEIIDYGPTDPPKYAKTLFAKPKPTVEEMLTLIRSFPPCPILYDRTEDEILGYGIHGYSA